MCDFKSTIVCSIFNQIIDSALWENHHKPIRLELRTILVKYKGLYPMTDQTELDWSVCKKTYFSLEHPHAMYSFSKKAGL